MICNTFRDNVLAYTENQLPKQLAETMDDHLKECEACSHILAEFKIVAGYFEEEKAIEPRPYAETRILEGILTPQERFSGIFTNLIKNSLQPAYLSLLVIFAIALGVYVGFRQEKQYSSALTSEDQIESIRSDLNVPDFMDEDNTSLN
jgi:hypothetical protein